MSLNSFLPDKKCNLGFGIVIIFFVAGNYSKSETLGSWLYQAYNKEIILEMQYDRSKKGI
jgi:hypothetical protein